METENLEAPSNSFERMEGYRASSEAGFKKGISQSSPDSASYFHIAAEGCQDRDG
jgi:hypothetical protein